MYNAKDIAKYLLNLDKDKNVFNLKLATYNDKTFYEGNCRLNKILQLALNIYYAGTGKRLFKEKMYAYANGGVVLEIQENYKDLLNEQGSYKDGISDEHLIKVLNCLFNDLGKGMHIADVIRISHQDPEWIKKNKYSEREFQQMDLEDMEDWYKAKMKNLAYAIGDYNV